MARLAIPSSWAGALIRQRGPLRTYQWLWLLLCAAGALLTAGPRILSQPVVYTTAAAVQLDTRPDGGRYRELYTSGQPDDDFNAVREMAVALLRARADYAALGSPTLGLAFHPQADGRVLVAANGPNASAAQALADDAAEALARNARAAGGREIMRQLMGWELKVSLDGNPPATEFQRRLRTIIQTSAFPLNRPTEPVPTHITVDQLQPEDVSDLTRALEVRDEQIARIDLPNLDRRMRSAPSQAATLIERERQQLVDGRAGIQGALDYLYRTYSASFNPDAQSAAYRSARAQPGTEIPRYIVPLLALAALVGLVLGGIGVAVDRSAGVMPKLRELWGYRELIRNLVLRDLRVRYKGSALGYLWTQLAPLLMMAVFWFVFSFIQPQQIAMFPVFLIVGLLPWNFCNEAVAGGARSVIDNANLIKKVFFPREVLPLVSVCSSLVNYLLSLPMMFLVMAVVQLLYPPLREQGRLFNFAPTIAYLPVLIGIQMLFLAGVALFMSALAVHFRDFVHLIGILLQFWFFLTPVVYSLDALRVSIGGVALAQVARWLNPMASLIEFYREILYGNTVQGSQVPTPGLPALTSVLRVLITALVALAFGYWFFQRRSGQFGEEI
jgi:lipopolysaccharide transport system permease protein